jgi:hypothetical protein
LKKSIGFFYLFWLPTLFKGHMTKCPIEATEQRYRLIPPESTADRTKDQMITALRRRLDEMKQAITAKDVELRQKQREIDRLYGKLAVGSSLTSEELRQQLQDALMRLAVAEDQQSK